MLIQIFRPPNDGDKLMDCKLGDICDSLSLEYEDFFCGVGTFTLELPVNTVFADKISENVLLYCRDDDICFIVKNILEAVDKLTITGYTLNGLLRDRLTMPRETGVAGAEGKDCISGSTETCVKHFVDYNMISSDDEARNYPRLAVAEDMGRGIVEDSNLVGMECVDDIVRSMCESAELGYRISLNIDSDASGPLLIFDVNERVDRTANQSERNRVIFSVGLKNITGMQRETGITAEKNALWCDTGGLNGFVFKGDEAPISWNRREEYISLAVTDEYSESEIQLFARKEMADKFAETDSLTIDAGNPLDYGKMYRLGDIVTVWDKHKSVQLNSVISAVTVKRSGTEHTVSLTLGESKPKLLDSYAKQTDILKKNQRDFPASEIVNTTTKLGTLSTYTYLTDNSIKYNGTTYTVEKNDSGLITKIANDKGGEFAPEIGGDITDVAFHNAVFTAVAMLCGVGSGTSSELMPAMDGVNWYYDAEHIDSVTEWRNLAGTTPMALSGVSYDGGVLTIPGGGYATVDTELADDNTFAGDVTFYVVAGHVRGDSSRGYTQWAGFGNRSNTTYREITIQNDAGGTLRATTMAHDITFTNAPTTVFSNNYYVIAAQRSGSTLTVYLNGVKGNNGPCTDFSPTFVMGGYYRNGEITCNSRTVNYKCVAIAGQAHDEADILTNMNWLMNKYSVT